MGKRAGLETYSQVCHSLAPYCNLVEFGLKYVLANQTALRFTHKQLLTSEHISAQIKLILYMWKDNEAQKVTLFVSHVKA